MDALEREAENNNIPFQSFPDKKSISEMRNWIDSIQPDYIFSISFPFLLSKEILSYGYEKFINFHPGPLPQYRGVMPVFEVLKNQESQTAICAHFMNDHFDKGNIIFNDPVVIEDGDTYGKLTVRLSNRMSHVVLNMANMIQFGSRIPSMNQDESDAYYYEKPQFSDTYINWKKMSASEIISLVNACNPWNTGADASLMGEQVKIITGKVVNIPHNNTIAGTIIAINEDSIHVACSDNKQITVEIISIDEGIMTVKQFISRKELMGSVFY